MPHIPGSREIPDPQAEAERLAKQRHPGSPPRRITIPIQEDTLLEHLLRLPDDVRLVAAGTERRIPRAAGDTRPDTLILTVDYPGAPDDAAEAIPLYTDLDQRGIIEFIGCQWFRADGTPIPDEPR